jgi:putative redox protein
MITGQAEPARDAPNLVLPAWPPRAWAIYAFRGARTTGPGIPSALPSALVALGIGVLTLDLGSAPPYATRPSEDADLTRVGLAADTLRSEHGAPSLLIGHAAAGPAVLAAAATLPDVRAVVTVGSSAPRARRVGNVPLLVLHAPNDPVVPVREAGRVFAAARHPRSFIALDGIDHDVSQPRHARRVAGLITAWAEPYLPDPAPSPPCDPTGSVVVIDAGTGRYTQSITAGRHLLTADEPVSVGGADAGPNPYELLLAALGACTSMTIRMYAERKGLPLLRTTVRLRHDRVHAKDCEQCEQNVGMLSRIRREIDIEGPLTDQDRRRLVEIADRCPVHRTLRSEVAFEYPEA